MYRRTGLFVCGVVAAGVAMLTARGDRATRAGATRNGADRPS
jgi:hypothetical protein